MLVYDTYKHCSSIISEVYAPAQFQDKDCFWQQLEQMNDVIDLSWCIIGDLNELANCSEKRGGKRYPPSRFARLKIFMNGLNVVSVPVTGYPFT